MRSVITICTAARVPEHYFEPLHASADQHLGEDVIDVDGPGYIRRNVAARPSRVVKRGQRALHGPTDSIGELIDHVRYVMEPVTAKRQ